MLQSIQQLYDEKLGALDGEIGRIKDFYFSDQSWVVRYLVADTGTWLASRQVLLSPHAIGKLYEDGKVMPVNLTRGQVENSPAIDAHKPVSRQFEEEYHRYYGWPYYWEGDGLWGGMRSFPILEEPPKFLPGEKAAATNPSHKPADAHLRSTQAVKGYHLQTNDGIVGHVCDFMMDNESWAIAQIVVKTGHRFTGKEVMMPVSQVDRISYEESTVFVNLTKELKPNTNFERASDSP
jgi:hypothetical protein